MSLDTTQSPAGEPSKAAPKDGEGKPSVENNSGTTSEISPLELKNKELLAEKQRAQLERDSLREELEKIKNAQKQQAEKELIDKENYKKLFETRDKELNSVKEQLRLRDEAAMEHKKLNSFLEKVGGLAKKHYSSFVDTSRIPVSTSGEVDELAVSAYAEEFKKLFPELLAKAGNMRVPEQTAPVTNITKSLKGKTSEEILQLMLTK